MEPQVIAAIISGSIGAFAGISRALGNFNKKLDRKFDRIQRDVDELKNSVIHDYVLKEDFLREMQGVHSKLDRILDHLLNHNQTLTQLELEAKYIFKTPLPPPDVSQCNCPSTGLAGCPDETDATAFTD